MPDLIVNEFDTDAHRRVTSLCSRPRSVEEIRKEALQDANLVAALAPDQGKDPLADILGDLVKQGLVKNIGKPKDVKAAIAATDKQGVLTLSKDQRKAYRDRADGPGWPHFLPQAGDWYVMTEEAYRRLQGADPRSPVVEIAAMSEGARNPSQQQTLDDALETQKGIK